MASGDGKAAGIFMRFINRELFGIPMAVIACAVGAAGFGCLLALSAAGN